MLFLGGKNNFIVYSHIELSNANFLVLTKYFES